MTPSPFRQVWSAPALLSLLVLACNNTPPVTTPDLPQVTVRLNETSIVGRGFKLTISTSGCERVQLLELYNDTTRIKQVSPSGAETPVEVSRTELQYQTGIATPLSLSARVTCDDGRTNVSQGQSATFFPVEEVIEPVDDKSQVVTDYFVVEGSGDTAAFIGCAVQGARSYLYKVDRHGTSSPKQVEMKFPCDVTTTITERKPAGASGIRWVYTPGKGMLALNSDFTVAFSTTLSASILNLVVAPNGDALIYNSNALTRVTRAGKREWERNISEEDLQAPIFADPIVRTATNTIVVPLNDQRYGDSDSADINLAVLNFDTGRKVTGSPYKIDTVTKLPAVAFNDTGTVFYMGQQLQNGVMSVRACAIGQTKPCQAGNPQSRLWINDTLPGYLAALVPYDNDQRLAVIGSNRFWFLDVRPGSPVLGLPINKDQQALSPAGALVGRFAQPGKGSAFFMFNSAPGNDSVPNPHPVEILATDQAERGLLYSYQMPGGQTLYGALDEAGTLWLRVGRKLVRPLALSEYRGLR